MAQSDQFNLHLDPGMKVCSPWGMTSGSARGSGGLAAMLVGFLKGMDCSDGSGDFPHPIFSKNRFICAFDGCELRSSRGLYNSEEIPSIIVLAHGRALTQVA